MLLLRTTYFIKLRIKKHSQRCDFELCILNKRYITITACATLMSCRR